MIDQYEWGGGREALYRFGPADAPVVVMLLPLFEEHNRTRTFAVALLRVLGSLGVASVLPDLPGQGDSAVPTERATVEAWRQAIGDLITTIGTTGQPHLATLRGAAMLDSVQGVRSIWRLAPMPGRAVLDDLRRAEAVGGRREWAGFTLESPPANLVGNALSWPLYAALEADQSLTTPDVLLRTVRLESDPAAADLKLPGPPLWRRAEPGHDPELADRLARDLAEWVRRCEA